MAEAEQFDVVVSGSEALAASERSQGLLKGRVFKIHDSLTIFADQVVMMRTEAVGQLDDAIPASPDTVDNAELFKQRHRTVDCRAVDITM